jgi:hypothetical protein
MGMGYCFDLGIDGDLPVLLLDVRLLCAGAGLSAF